MELRATHRSPLEGWDSSLPTSKTWKALSDSPTLNQVGCRFDSYRSHHLTLTVSDV
jgi:hypothetical protein